MSWHGESSPVTFNSGKKIFEFSVTKFSTLSINYFNESSLQLLSVTTIYTIHAYKGIHTYINVYIHIHTSIYKIYSHQQIEVI